MTRLVVRPRPCVWNRSTKIVTGLVVALVCSLPWFKINVEPSVPYGLYRLTAVPPVVERGMLVLVPVPDQLRFWHTSWVPLLKPVAAVAGDAVCVTEQTLWVEARWTFHVTSYGPVYQEAHGRALPHLDEGCVVVPPGAVFLASTAYKSLDGRYFGMTPLTDLTARAHPVVTWR